MTTHIEVREKTNGRFVYVKRDRADKHHDLVNAG